jgi:GT2 family glycosyltransferase
MSKIGIGIITCNRNDFLQTCKSSINKDWYDEIVIINDGELPVKDSTLKVINNEKNIGVCKSKNKALKYLLDTNCDHIFLVEDDMKFLDNIFAEYIRASKITGIQHFMFGYHGPANKAGISGGTPRPRKIVDYDSVKIALNQHCVGAVCYYTRESLEDIGLFDEQFDKNNFEHVEHSFRLAKAGYSTPYWWWSDIADSLKYVQEQACSEANSAIRRGDNWQQSIIDSAYIFKEKHGVMPAWNDAVPDTPVNKVVDILKKLKNED